jgi:hypothetical protein
MQTHTNRLVVAAVLIAAGVAGGFFVLTAQRRTAALDAAGADISSRIQRMIVTAGDIASAQQAYVAPGQPDQPWLERAAMLLQQYGEETAALRPLLQSADAMAGLDQTDRNFRSIVVIDGKARQYLQEEQDLLAADLIFSEGRDTIGALEMTLGGLRAAEQATATARIALVERQQWVTITLVAGLWLVGLVALVPLPGSVIRDSGFASLGFSSPESRIPNPEPADAAASPASIDLAAAADVCGALARAADTASLRDVLARAAAVLDARGIIVWMGAGEELFPALSYGYDERMIERLGPIPRGASNATAEAWRTAQLRTVAADAISHGAVAVPVSGIGGCVGVFAAEVRHGREDDPGTQAIAAMIAAQLAGIVSAWPAASTPAEMAGSGSITASRG